MSYGTSSGGGIRWLPLVLGLIAAGVMLARGCDEGPFGQHIVVALSPQQEAALGAQSFQHILQESDVVSDDPAVGVVNRIGERLAKAAADPDFLEILKLKPQKYDWEFRVVRSRQVNAFCLPGGKVVVYTGILPVCETENGLATVMGHEIGHALARHGAQRMAQQQLVQIGQVAVAGSVGDLPPEQQQAIMVALNAGSQYGILLPYSRGHESEADHIGLLLMAAAGYDPNAAITFWKRMSKVGGKKPPEFASTHPNDERRAGDLEKWLPQALSLYRRSAKQDGERKLPAP